MTELTIDELEHVRDVNEYFLRAGPPKILLLLDG